MTDAIKTNDEGRLEARTINRAGALVSAEKAPETGNITASEAVKAGAVTDRAPNQANAGRCQRRDASDFLSRVIPWPGTLEDPGYVGIHWMNKKTPRGMPGKPARTVKDALGWVDWISKLPEPNDIYFCTAL